MKKGTFLLAVFFLTSTPAILSQKPVIYPGAMAQRPGSNYFLTTDSYEKVRAFYAGIYGEPDHETEKTATFFYEETIFEPAGIHLYSKSPGSKGATRVFTALCRLKERGQAEGKEVLSRQRYDEIVRNYEHLKDHYYLYKEDERGKFVPEDETIYLKYNRKLDASAIENMNVEEITQKAQQLLMQGKMQEGRELLEQRQNSMSGHLEFSGSTEAVDEWIECLEEMDACKFPVLIRIDNAWSGND